VPRQQTLRGAIDWSHDLLTQAERVLFRRLSAFRGGFDLRAAEAVCTGDGLEPPEALGLVVRLVDRSMVVPEETPQGTARYRLLETIGQYAAQQLRDSGEEETVGRRHADYFLTLAETDSAFGAPRQEEWLERIARDHDNVRAALDWLQPRDPDGALRLVGALGWFWFLRGLAGEGRSRLAAALGAAPEPTVHRARALKWAGSLARHQADYAVALTHLDEALAICNQHGDAPGIAEMLHRRGACLYERGDYAAARADLEASLALSRDLGDRRDAAGTLGLLGVLAHHQGDLAVARAKVEECLSVLRDVGDVYSTSQSLAILGRVALQQADYDVAHAALVEGVALARRLGNTFGLFLALEGLAGLDAVGDRPERALRLAGAVSAAREATGTMLAAHWQTTAARWLDAARARLSRQAAEAAWEAGRRMTLEQAIEDAFDASAPATTRPSWQDMTSLTERQWEIASLVAEGLTNRQIADRLVLSERTVEGHLERIRNRLSVHARAQIAAWFVEHRSGRLVS
jgi:non-specific serine/threonine protein kinase